MVLFPTHCDPQESNLKSGWELRKDNWLDPHLGIQNAYPNPQIGKLTDNPFLLGEKLASDLLPLIKKESFDFVITFSDGIAQGVATKLEEFGLDVPKEIQVIGFDHIDSLEYLKHVISTIEVPVDQMMANLINILEVIPIKNQSLRSHTKLHLK